MNYFTDTTVKNGTVYQYEVESVSITGNESASRTKATYLEETVDYTILVTHTILTTGVALTWLPISMAGMREIRIYRQAPNERPVLLKKLSPGDTAFTDLKVLPGKSYVYVLTAGMENGEERVLNQGVLVNYLK
jgi:fibronectin type 3 domain-containing protein